ncbi:hypothetical protein IKF34_00540 [Candidatus Saccharibacteria bacterium]|nr:hypothetical protein [Candidatus Saccharibacteria bacterium]
MKKSYSVIINTPPKDVPRHFELSAAKIIAEYFKTNIVFLRPFSMKSPDLNINGKIWELKSPIGKSKNTIHNNFKEARKQTVNIIIDLRRCKLNEINAYSKIRAEIKKRKRKNGKILVISKKSEVLDFTDILIYNNR